MSDTAIKPASARSRWSAAIQNPVMLKELRSRMRGNRAFLVLSAYLTLLSAGIGLIFLIMLASDNALGDPEVYQIFGKAIFGVVVGMELLTISFIAPALTAGAIASERERQTYDLLRTTLLSGRSLVFGKLLSALSFILLLLFAAFPLQSLAFLFGGVAIEEVIIATILLVVSALAFSSFGLFFSSLTKRTLVSTVMAYAFAILLIFGLPLFIVTAVGLFNSFFFGFSGGPNALLEAFLIIGGWILVSLNPVATAVVTEVLLIEEQAVFYTSLPLPTGGTFLIISPWISYTLLYLLISILLIWLSIRRVKRVEK